MTVLGWILFSILTICILCCCFGTAMYNDRKQGYYLAGLISVVLIAVIGFGMNWYYNNTASGKRALKSQESNFGDGIERTVKVYDVNGQLITEYDGKFDITYDDDRILFDDEKGKRHVIYYPTGTVVIDER